MSGGSSEEDGCDDAPARREREWSAVPGSDPDLDYVFDALAHGRRRHALEYLDEEGDCPLPDLARHVAAVERGVGREAVDESERQSVRTSLYHGHVRALDADDVVTFDEETETVAPGRRADEVFAALRAVKAACRRERSPGDSSGRGGE